VNGLRIVTVTAIRLAARAVIAACGAAIGWLAASPGPAAPALAVGAGTWLVLASRRDIAAVVGHQPGSAPVATGRSGSAVHADQDPT
jgi:hypothetical protein